jgi:hypothetical protein
MVTLGIRELGNGPLWHTDIEHICRQQRLPNDVDSWWRTSAACAGRLGRTREGILDTLRVQDELGFRPIYPLYYDASEAGAL